MPIVYKNAADGMIHVCVPAVSVDDPEGFTLEDAYTRVLVKDVPKDATAITRIKPGDVDLTDVFRDGWTSMNADNSFNYDGDAVKTIVDTKLKTEISGYVDEMNLLTKMGRDTTAIQAKITDCQSRITQFDNMTVSKSTDSNTISTLKGLIK